MSMGIDDGSTSKGYYMHGSYDYDNPENIHVVSIGNSYEEYQKQEGVKPVTDQESMENNSKNEIGMYIVSKCSYAKGLGYSNPQTGEESVNMEASFDTSEDGKNTITLKPADLDEFNSVYMEENSRISGTGTNEYHIDDYYFEDYEVTIVLNSQNAIETMTVYSKETAVYKDQKSTAENTYTITFSKMEKGILNSKSIKSFFDMYERGEVGEGDTITLDVKGEESL